MAEAIVSNNLKSDKVNSGIEKKIVGKEKKLWARLIFLKIRILSNDGHQEVVLFLLGWIICTFESKIWDVCQILGPIRQKHKHTT